jgi:hypothetical protein
MGGRKPAEREVKVAARAALGFESTVPCDCCGAPSRRVRQQWRACANGHKFLKKSDQR